MSAWDEDVIVVHRAELPLWVQPQLQGFCPGHLHIKGLESLWLRLEDGTRVEGPPDPEQPVATAWKEGLYRHEPPVSEPTARWADRLEGQPVRAQGTGMGVLIDVLRGAQGVRALWWAHEERVLCLANRVPNEARIESVGEGFALWVDPRVGTAELLAPQERRGWRVALPSRLASGIQGQWSLGASRYLWAVPELGLMVFACHSAIVWMEFSAVRALSRLSEVRWRTVEHHPLADFSARVGGEVVFVSPTRVMVNLDDLNQLRLPALPGLERGQRVVLVGRLSAASGMARYLWLEHGGARLRLVEDTVGEERGAVESRTLGKAPAKKRATSKPAASSYTALAPWLRQSLRLSLPEEPEAVRDLLHTAVGPDTTPEQALEGEQLVEVMVVHLAERLHEGGAVLHEARFANETDDLVGELREAVAPWGVSPRHVAGTEPWELVEDTLPGRSVRLAMEDPAGEATDFINATLQQKRADGRLYRIAVDERTLWLALSRTDAKRLGKLGIECE
jgi:hypothetical protein